MYYYTCRHRLPIVLLLHGEAEGKMSKRTTVESFCVQCKAVKLLEFKKSSQNVITQTL